MNEISQYVVGIISPQVKDRSASVNRSQEASVIKAQTIENLNREEKATQQAVLAVDGKVIDEAVANLNDYAQSVNRQLQFSVDENSGKTVVKVIDADTGETIRDIPPEEILKMQNQLRETSERFFQNDEEGVSLLFQGKA